jgi:hypothetical protein
VAAAVEGAVCCVLAATATAVFVVVVAAVAVEVEVVVVAVASVNESCEELLLCDEWLLLMCGEDPAVTTEDPPDPPPT